MRLPIISSFNISNVIHSKILLYRTLKTIIKFGDIYSKVFLELSVRWLHGDAISILNWSPMIKMITNLILYELIFLTRFDYYWMINTMDYVDTRLNYILRCASVWCADACGSIIVEYAVEECIKPILSTLIGAVNLLNLCKLIQSAVIFVLVMD